MTGLEVVEAENDVFGELRTIFFSHVFVHWIGEKDMFRKTNAFY